MAVRRSESPRRSPLRIALLALVVAALTAVVLRSSHCGEPAVDETVDRRAPAHEQRASPFKASIPETAPACSISGTVRDAQSRALHGARVCAHGEDGLIRAVCTSSLAGGFYRLDGLAAGRWFVGASAAGHRPATYSGASLTPHAVVLGQAEAIAGIDITLASGGQRIAGIVRDATGGEIEAAIVAAAPASGWRGGETPKDRVIGVTDATGSFEVWVGHSRVEIAAAATGYASNTRVVHAPSDDVVIALFPASTIVGVVHDEAGAPVSDASVRTSFVETKGNAMTDAEGAYRIGGLLPGRYRVFAEAPGLGGASRESIALGFGETSSPVEIVLQPRASRELVVHAEGIESPCVGGFAILSDVERSTRRSNSIDERGHATFSSLLLGRYEVALRCDDVLVDASYPTIEVLAPEARTVRLEVSKGGSASGRVLYSNETPAAAALVSITGDAAGPRTRCSTTTDDSGAFELGGCALGPAKLEANSEDAGVTTLPVVLEPGHSLTDVRVVLAPTGTLTGSVVERGPGEAHVAGHLRIQATGSSTLDVLASSEGGFMFPRIPPGEYDVRVLDEQWGFTRRLRDGSTRSQHAIVRADRATELSLRLLPATLGIRGRVLASGAPLADSLISLAQVPVQSGGGRESVRPEWRYGAVPITTDEDGRFEIEGLADQSYLLRAEQSGGRRSSPVLAQAGVEMELVIQEAGSLSGIVTSADGSRVDAFTVRASGIRTGTSFAEVFEATAGAWAVDDLPPDSYSLTIQSSIGREQRVVEVTEGEDLVVRTVFAAAEEP